MITWRDFPDGTILVSIILMEAPDDLLEWYDNLLDSYVSWDQSCDSLETPRDAPSNRTLGWLLRDPL